MRAGVTSSVVSSRAWSLAGPDVAVPGRRDADRRVVERVQQADRVVLRVDVAIAAGVGQQRDEQDEREGDAEAHEDVAHRTVRPAGELDLDAVAPAHGPHATYRAAPTSLLVMPLPDVLRKLLTAAGPSGYETAPAAVFAEAGRAFTDDVEVDVMGSAVARVKGTDRPAPPSSPSSATSTRSA